MVIASCAFVSSFIGAACVSMIPVSVLRPLVLLMLIIMAVYTFMKSSSAVHTERPVNSSFLLMAALGSILIGFYDGIFGPEQVAFYLLLHPVLSVDFYMLLHCLKLVT